jgi:hypothetical protein
MRQRRAFRKFFGVVRFTSTINKGMKFHPATSCPYFEDKVVRVTFCAFPELAHRVTPFRLADGLVGDNYFFFSRQLIK